MLKRIVPVFLMLVFCLCFCLSVPASAAGGTLYENNFENGDTGLENVDGAAEIAEEKGNHILKLTKNSEAYFHGVLKSEEAENFDLSLRVRLDRCDDEQWNWVKLYFRSPAYSENSAFHMQLWTSRVGFAAKGGNGGRDEMKPITENANFAIRLKNWYTVEIFARGDTMTAYINGKEALKMTDKEFTSGGFGFASWGFNFSIDDLKIVTRSAGDPVATTFKKPETTTSQTSSTSSASSSTPVSSGSGQSGASSVASSTESDASSDKQDADSTNTKTDNTISAVSENGGSNGSAIIKILGIVGIVVVMAVGACAIVYIIKNMPKKESNE